ncbi:hypothetical protein HNQ95_004627 [Aminobacter ciceronei]|uniref:DUF4238 domain-containing protein n=2 Tax=Aminobacter ciceronei TaxID=150723 RepID=A0ABR6CCC8_9HYPH|nr:hypothetical protein [Aminobacter ciceronei]MBA9022688.1 hypothetical protein [Aminobacter ciceronei]
MILKNFLNDRGGLYFWRREFPVGHVRTTTPANLFLEDDLYTVIGDEGERDSSLEHGFSKLEAAGAHFLRQLLDIVRSGKKPHMGEDVWEFLQLFRYYSDKRSAAWHSRFLSDEEFNAVLEEVANKPHVTDADRAWLANPKDVDRIKRNSRIAAQATGPTEELLEAMRGRGLAIYIAPRSASFVLGDHPTAVAKIGSATEGAFGGKLSFMPIASDVALGYSWQPRTVHLEQLTRPQLRTMNEAMTRQSEMIAGRSQALVASLSRVSYETPEYFTTSDYVFE